MIQVNFHDKWMPEPFAGCWLWTASVRPDGYGQSPIQGKMEGVHRASWIIHRGEIPTGMQVLHRCDTPTCVNPDHLFIGCNADNMRDAAAKGRFNQAGENNGALQINRTGCYSNSVTGRNAARGGA
jgi:HNH endonuclease